MAIDVVENVGNIVAAIGALGTASFGLVDAAKAFGGPSLVGFGFIGKAIAPFCRDAADRRRLAGTLRGNWINGTALAEQKAIAKSLVKLRLSPDTAGAFAAAAGLEAAGLQGVARKIASQQPMDPAEADAFGRFDLALTALLDDAYNHADQRYRNAAKLIATIVSVVLAIAGLVIINPQHWSEPRDLAVAVLCGLVATPLAPIAKDFASALQAGVKVAQAVVRR
jgi:hypothetical protein